MPDDTTNGDVNSPSDVPLEKRLAARGFRRVADWGGWPTQVTGEIPPDWHWFYFRERSGNASLEVYAPGRYPFAPPAEEQAARAGTPSGWDPAALGVAEEWSASCPTPADTGIQRVLDGFDALPAELVEELILKLIDRWRTGAPSE